MWVTCMLTMFEQLREKIETYIPSIVIDILLLCLVLFLCMLFIKYNLKVLAWITRTGSKIYKFFGKLFGKFSKTANQTMYRQATINQNTRVSAIYKYFDDMITDMDMHKDGVTVFGLIMFLLLVTLFFTIIATYLFNLGTLAIVAFIAIFYVDFTVLKIIVSTQVAHRESMILDAIDLLVSDIRGGVYNAIVRYKDNGINPEIGTYFNEFVNNITQNGWTFTQAMQMLNKELGTTFTDFATKAILYENNQDEDTLEIFSATVEMNANKRMLREENNNIFAQVRLTFWLCLILIVGSAVLFCAFDAAVANVFLHSSIGRIMIVIDIFIVAFTLAKISALKNGKL